MPTTHTISESTLTDLQQLCKHCHESYEGYRRAAEEVDSPWLEDALLRAADRHEMRQEDLEEVLDTPHTDLPDGPAGQAGQAGHSSADRWWVQARAALLSNDTKAVLTAAIRGERANERRCRAAIERCEDPDLRELLDDHLADVRACRESLEEMRMDHDRTMQVETRTSA